MTDSVKAENYPVVVTRDGSEYILRIRELFLVQRDADLDSGMEKIRQQARDKIAEQSAIGAGGELPRPGGVAREDRETRRLKVFAFKGAVVALILVIVIAAAAASFPYAMRNSAKKFGRGVIIQLEQGLQKAAAKELTPERREKLRIAVAEAVPHLKPYIDELRPLFIDFCPVPQ